MYFVVVDVGCIECGEQTNILGIFTNEDEAEVIRQEHLKRQEENWAGEHYFITIGIEELDKEYRVEY